jgi:hypothetical protein
MGVVAQLVDFEIQQTGFPRPLDDAFIERPGEHGREQSEHVNFHIIVLVLVAVLLLAIDFETIDFETIDFETIDFENKDENENETCFDLSFLFHNLQRAAQTLLRAAGQQQRPDRVDGHALPPDDLAHVLRMQAQLVNSCAFPFDRRDRHGIGILHQPFDDVFEKGLHGSTLESRA